MRLKRIMLRLKSLNLRLGCVTLRLIEPNVRLSCVTMRLIKSILRLTRLTLRLSKDNEAQSDADEPQIFGIGIPPEPSPARGRSALSHGIAC